MSMWLPLAPSIWQLLEWLLWKACKDYLACQQQTRFFFFFILFQVSQSEFQLFVYSDLDISRFVNHIACSRGYQPGGSQLHFALFLGPLFSALRRNPKNVSKGWGSNGQTVMASPPFFSNRRKFHRFFFDVQWILWYCRGWWVGESFTYYIAFFVFFMYYEISLYEISPQ